MHTVAEKEVAAKVARKLGPIGPAIDKLSALRERKRGHEAEIKEIEAEYAVLEEQLLEKLQADGMDKATGKAASVSVSSTVVGNAEDWTKVEAYIKRTGNFQLFQRRLSDPACREIWESGKKIPGVEPFTKKRLNLRNVT